MSYFVVFQSKTYSRESQEGMLWAPKANRNGRTFSHWTNMTKVRPGDIIFSVVNNYIKSVNIASSQAYDSIMPGEFTEYGWDRDGWKVDAEYKLMNHPIRVTSIIDDIISFLPREGSPFQRNGRGNQGYLFELPEAAGLVILNRLNLYNDFNIILDHEQKEIVHDIDSVIQLIDNQDITGSEGLALVKYRIGHGYFKKELLKVQNMCPVCELDLVEILIASHIKPWKESLPSEKVDFNNGLLLCPNHDRLFDSGLITFSNDGELLISNRIDSGQREKLALIQPVRLNMSAKGKAYMDWHRNTVFKSE